MLKPRGFKQQIRLPPSPPPRRNEKEMAELKQHAIFSALPSNDYGISNQFDKHQCPLSVFLKHDMHLWSPI